MKNINEVIKYVSTQPKQSIQDLFNGTMSYKENIDIENFCQVVGNCDNDWLWKYYNGTITEDEHKKIVDNKIVHEKIGTILKIYNYIFDDNIIFKNEDYEKIKDCLAQLWIMRPRENFCYEEKFRKLIFFTYLETKDERFREIALNYYSKECKEIFLIKNHSEPNYNEKYGIIDEKPQVAQTSSEDCRKDQEPQDDWIIERFGDYMAKRPAWYVSNDGVICEEFEFEWNGGFAIKQKQKNINKLHTSIKQQNKGNALEVSSKGTIDLGKELSAFSLKYNDKTVENIFQSSKKFELGGPYRDLLDVTPKEAKQDERIRNSGGVISFCFEDEEWPIEPKTLFYDYIFIQALIQNYGKDLNLENYDWFTDIEFNPKKSVNCQARSVAIYKLIKYRNAWDCLKNMETWKTFHINHVKG